MSTYLDNHCHVLYSPCLVVSGILVCVPQWTGVATHGPATGGGASDSRQPSSGRGHGAMGGSWTLPDMDGE